MKVPMHMDMHQVVLLHKIVIIQDFFRRTASDNASIQPEYM
jgi:hypothetical protein